MNSLPHVLLICGMPTSGKTNFGNWLRDTHGWLHLDLELADCLYPRPETILTHLVSEAEGTPPDR